jgi:hypothetical protein
VPELAATEKRRTTARLADEPATFPTNHEHLQELIDKALGPCSSGR